MNNDSSCDTHVRYFVYVIALAPEVGRVRKFASRNSHRHPKSPCVYVGSTALAPERRFEQHLNGYRSNSFVRRFGVQLVPSLYDRYNPIESREEAERTEQHVAERLKKKGFGVWYG